MKCCSRCRSEQPLEQFNKMSRARDGKQPWCKACMADHHRQRVADGKYVRHRREGAKAHQRLRKYGLTPAQFWALLEDQGFCCASCGAELDVGFRTHIDHCHATGRVRSILCGGCNVALGHLGEDPVRIDALAAYARRIAK